MRRTRDLSSARSRHYAIRAHTVAADADLHPAVVLAGALGGEPAGEPLELEEPLGGDRVRNQELRQLVNLAGAERDVHEREPGEHILLDRLRPAAADAHHDLGAIALDALGLPQVGDEPVIRLLADRAGVEQDQIRLLATRRLAVAERLEHPLHPLGVVLVHLAAEGGDVVALHRRPRVTAARLSPGGIRARPARLSRRSRSWDRWPEPA